MMTNPPREWVRLLAPQQALLYAFSCAVLVVLFSIYLATQAHWLGIGFAEVSHSSELQITSLAANHPNARNLRMGDKVMALIDGHGQIVTLHPQAILEEPDVLASYALLNNFFEHQNALTRALRTPPLQLVLTDERTVPVVAIDRSLKALPFYFWWQVLIGLACFLVGAGVWAFQRDQTAAQLLFLSSIGVLGFTTLSAVYSSRELVLDGDLFRLLLIATHFSTILHTSALLALVWIYPRPLGKPYVPTLIFIAGGVAWLLDTFQLVPSSLWSHYFFTSAAFLVGLSFVYGQWRATRQLPIERAIMRWFVMAIFLASLINILILKAPLFFEKRPSIGQGWVFIAQLFMYAGLALGVVRYRLFNLEHWWFRAWLWFFAGLTVIAVDLALLMTLDMGREDALLMSLLLTGWLYFPLRQWVWVRVMPRDDINTATLLTKMTTHLIGAGTASRIQEQWPAILRDIFTPLEIQEQSGPCHAITIEDNGSLLYVPALAANKTLALYYPAAGRRLFNPRDVKRITALLDIAQHAAHAADAREEGARLERERIMRDLHDDLGARLLSLVYTTENEESQYLARAAIDDLHDILASAQGDPISLSAAINKWNLEGRRRFQEAGIQGRFSVDAGLSSPSTVIFLSARVHVNTERILREVISNSIRHGKPENIDIEFVLSTKVLMIIVTDDGRTTDPAQWQSGHGLQTIRTRAREINADPGWRRTATGGCQFSLRLILDY
jgi:signal transduction histidine kinase